MRFTDHIEGGDFTHAGKAASHIKKVLKQLNVEPRLIKRVVICLYEAEVNVVAHAWKGTIETEIDADKVFIRVMDEGPGIANIDLAMQEGFSTASPQVREMGFGAGMGLPNMKRNADLMTIQSIVNRGVTVEITTFLK